MSCLLHRTTTAVRLTHASIACKGVQITGNRNSNLSIRPTVHTQLTRPSTPLHTQQPRYFASIPKYAWGVPTRLSPGDTCSLSRSFSASDVHKFGEAGGDWNPVHFPKLHAETTQREVEKWRSNPATKDLPLPQTGIFRFNKPIVHGMLTASLIGTLFATHLPGAIYMQQSVTFRAPVYYDENVTATIEVIKVEKKRVTCKTTIEKTDAATGKPILVIEGEAKVMVETLQD